MKHVKASAAVLVLCAGLLGCANLPPAIAPGQLLQDELFLPPDHTPDAAGLFALSETMRSYLQTGIPAPARRHDPRQALIDALYSKSQLGLSYDASVTRNAAEAFEARAGNCLSLVIMTAAFAKAMGLPVSYQEVKTEDFYTRSGNLTLSSGHVNLVLGEQRPRSAFSRGETEFLTIDFLQQAELRWQRTRPLQEQTIVAMYMNNRAAEALALGQIDNAYWFAREALHQDPGFLHAANTLGVIFSSAGHAGPAETAFRRVLEREPDHVSAMSNLVRLLARLGRAEEASMLAARLARLQPVPPFHHFNLGREAMARGDLERAIEQFERELRLQPYQDEVHFWAAQAYWKAGRQEQAARHLGQAVEYSGSLSAHDRYSAKLDLLRNSRVH